MFFPTRRPRSTAPPLPAGRRKPSHPAARLEGDLMEGAPDHSDRRPGPSSADMGIGQRRAALVALLDLLAAAGYDFVSPTPATHRRVASRRERARAANLRDIFGWGRPFDPNDLDPTLLATMSSGGLLVDEGASLRSAVRVSALDGRLHLHSARSDASDAVFLGPDSYRFVRFLTSALCGTQPRSILDVGAGAGAGALALAARLPHSRVVAGDVNPFALALLAANAAHARLSIEIVAGSGPGAAAGEFDLIIANPPYLADGEHRTYRDGGGALGMDLALAWVSVGLHRLRPRGRFVLYTGSPIIEGRDMLRIELERLAAEAGASMTYEEIDPDVFGGMLAHEGYREVERIAAIGAVLSRQAAPRRLFATRGLRP
ncbi:MAG: methyltransferase [Brevundimonas sp.]|jgi:methylase of polypeptide subunit release factors|uniref:methyltransferase n=1 Tax=Brevundimonas sp. TaxID=1871086 RepID=UPI0025BD46DD|nr:methyltransferase [Brevundimonas sp.]MCH4270097.1 methyltransferase [Brevundimonas sp.]